MQIFENEPMYKHTSFKVGGPARYFAKAENLDDLKAALALAHEKGLPHFILGNGTNLLVADKGYNGIVITLGGEFSEIVELGNGAYKVGAAAPLGRFARAALKQGFAGIHKLAGIPGTMGGAIYMNAGAYGQEIGTYCQTVTSIDSDGNIRERSASECKFKYRQSIFNTEIPGQAGDDMKKGAGDDIKRETIIAATFQLEAASAQGKTTEDLEAELQECMAKRKATQPLNKPNAGSTFKRLDKGSTDMPQQIAPGYYIENAGLKGFRIGGAEVSTLHANFIINAGDATAKDILALSEHVQKTVREKFNVELHREIILLGEF